MILNQVHLVVGRVRTDHSSVASALHSVRLRLLCARILSSVDAEMLLLLREIFLLP